MEPPTKKSRQENGEEQEEETCGWPNLPFEMRILVLNEMPLDTLANFEVCSKLCYDEVEKSENYCDRIEIAENGANFEIFLKKTWSRKLKTLIFDQKEIVCLNEEKVEIWRKQKTGDLVDCVIKYVNRYLVHFRRNLKSFTMNVTRNTSAKSKLIKGIRIKNMPKLENLQVYASRKQICLIKNGFVDFEQLKTITGTLVLPYTKLSFEQLLELKAREIEIYLMSLKSMDFNKFIRLWVDGKINPNFRKLGVDAEFNETLAKNKRMCHERMGLDYYDIDHLFEGISLTIFGACEQTEDYYLEYALENNGMRTTITVDIRG